MNKVMGYSALRHAGEAGVYSGIDGAAPTSPSYRKSWNRRAGESAAESVAAAAGDGASPSRVLLDHRDSDLSSALVLERIRDPKSAFMSWPIAFGAVCLHWMTGTVVLHALEGWTLPTAAYFASASMMTVGYGDPPPKLDSTRLFLSAYIWLSLTVIAFAISVFVGKAEGRVHEHVTALSSWLAVFWPILILLFVVVAGTIFYYFYEDWDMIEAIYFVTVTVSSTGFGDLLPSDDLSRGVTAVFVLVSVTATSNVIASLIDIHLDRLRRNAQNKFIDRGLTMRRLNSMISSDEGHVPSEADYLCYMLEKMCLVEPDHLHVMRERWSDYQERSVGRFQTLDSAFLNQEAQSLEEAIGDRDRDRAAGIRANRERGEGGGRDGEEGPGPRPISSPFFGERSAGEAVGLQVSRQNQEALAGGGVDDSAGAGAGTGLGVLERPYAGGSSNGNPMSHTDIGRGVTVEG
uniref:Potassium channel domain-containing protein n=1 Tax=Chromera velia CCMP2878 TaxID=1169474 RepID=A0A0G4HFT8_9ALVE|eukprot:Cvel_27175.t1-p1 / transcript=Cvel_27175.t1 / gene=Cvel_27175 / organism=Chromera_velia_CCMP2878 / gene_product=Two pore potassium channel a, putative / transcript_product=Two pore potassium channel a, putative / location=Cvel_scaffold3350:4456-10624(-) / protein_length=461 / sequence_SO=supercontig / SO=protein_coding / is_pseudo=false